MLTLSVEGFLLRHWRSVLFDSLQQQAREPDTTTSRNTTQKKRRSPSLFYFYFFLWRGFQTQQTRKKYRILPHIYFSLFFFSILRRRRVSSHRLISVWLSSVFRISRTFSFLSSRSGTLSGAVSLYIRARIFFFCCCCMFLLSKEQSTLCTVNLCTCCI